MSEDENTYGPGYGKNTSYNTITIIFWLLSVIGLGISAYWIFNKSKTTEDIDKAIKIENTDENLILTGSILTAIGAVVVFGIIVVNHKDGAKALGIDSSKDNTLQYMFLYLQHILSFSVGLALTIIYGNFVSAPTDNFPKTYLEEILVFSSIALIVVILVGGYHYFRGRKKDKGLVLSQHVITGIALLSSVIVSGSFVNTGNIPQEANIALLSLSILSLLFIVVTFYQSYNNSIGIFENNTKYAVSKRDGLIN